jgi:hypothetical protein
MSPRKRDSTKTKLIRTLEGARDRILDLSRVNVGDVARPSGKISE